MDPLDTIQRLRAVQLRRAVPRASFRHVHLSDRPLVIAAYHLAGELGAPLALMWGTCPDPTRASFLAVPEPRNRTLRFEALELFGNAMDAYLAPVWQRVTAPKTSRGRVVGTTDVCLDAPQIVVPNAATCAWLFGIVGRFTRYLPTDGPDGVPEVIRRTGANLTFFDVMRATPGGSVALAATDLLSVHFITGQLNGERQNLAAALAWVDPGDGLDGPEAAALAEHKPPAGPQSDPGWDADELEHLVARYHEATGAGKERARAALATSARAQLVPGWADTWRALAVVRQLPPAGHTDERWERDRYYWARHTERVDASEARFTRVPGALQAARGLRRQERLTEDLAAQMALDDPAIMAHAVARGDALMGSVVAVDALRREPNANGRLVTRPRMSVAAAVPFDRPPGTGLHLASAPAVTTLVDSITLDADGRQLVHLTVTAGAQTASTRGRLPTPGSHVVLSPFGPVDKYPDTLPDEVPWTHRLPEPTRADA